MRGRERGSHIWALIFHMLFIRSLKLSTWFFSAEVVLFVWHLKDMKATNNWVCEKGGGENGVQYICSLFSTHTQIEWTHHHHEFSGYFFMDLFAVLGRGVVFKQQSYIIHPQRRPSASCCCWCVLWKLCNRWLKSNGIWCHFSPKRCHNRYCSLDGCTCTRLS